MLRSSGIILALLLFSGLFTSCTYRFYQAACDFPAPGALTKQFDLDSTVMETSGLLCSQGGIWTFNDSGGEAALYSLDAGNGSLIRKSVVMNAANVDWESVAEDETHIFVADVGNNFGNRDTLTIYRIPRTALLSENPKLIHDGVITLSFNGEIIKRETGYSNRDCEAILAYGDSLYLFSKDWIEKSTSVYTLPKEPGHYSLSAISTYQVRFLVTGADILPGKHQVSLVGYRSYMPVVLSYEFENSPALISCGGKARLYPLRAGRQVEGICYDSRGNLLISAEKSLKKQALFRVGKPVL
jgi:hypothetical protein